MEETSKPKKDETIREFIKRNIENINERITSFKKAKYTDVEIKNHLHKKFLNELPDIKDDLIRKFKEEEYVKARISDTIANDFILYNTDLEKFYETYLYNEILKKIDTEELIEFITEHIKSELETNEYRYIRNNLKKYLKKSIPLLKKNGFSSNLLGINDGVMTAQAGDSAQFIFISRAILAGFNCSNVDVSASKYDAIIDYNDILLKVQVKGFSDKTFSLVNRTRGGQGIDHQHTSNKESEYTKDDCDIFVAVDKQLGACYIIPAKNFINKPIDELKRLKISENQNYLENWELIKKIANERK